MMKISKTIRFFLLILFIQRVELLGGRCSSSNMKEPKKANADLRRDPAEQSATKLMNTSNCYLLANQVRQHLLNFFNVGIKSRQKLTA